MRARTKDMVTVVRHPLVADRLARLRGMDLPSPEFRTYLEQAAWMLGYEALRNVPTRPVSVRTPVGEADGSLVDDEQLMLVPILRAGLAMVEPILRLVPGAVVGHFGAFRDEATLKPVTYYVSLPQRMAAETRLWILDPMLATGGSAAAAVQAVKERGAKHISLISVLSAPEGVEELARQHPDVHIYTAAVDERLNEDGFIVPGLGDAGDRAYNTSF